MTPTRLVRRVEVDVSNDSLPLPAPRPALGTESGGPRSAGHGAFVAAWIHRVQRALPSEPETPREAAARRIVCRVLGVAIALTLLLGARDRSRSTAPHGEAPQNLPIDVARDPRWRLRLLPGLGPARASAIVDDRAKHGPVESLDHLVRIRGVGPKLVKALRAAGAVAGPGHDDPGTAPVSSDDARPGAVPALPRDDPRGGPRPGRQDVGGPRPLDEVHDR